METVSLAIISSLQIKENTDKILPLLSAEEKTRAQRFVCEKDMLLSLGGAFLCRRRYGTNAVITRTPGGKPRVNGSFFSVSHSEDLIAAAFCDNLEVGVDLEKVRDGFEEITEYCFTEEEQASQNDLFELFTSKESLAKASGTGLVPSPISFPALPVEGPVSFRGKTYYRHTLPLDGYRLSVCLENSDFKIEKEICNEF